MNAGTFLVGGLSCIISGSTHQQNSVCDLGVDLCSLFHLNHPVVIQVFYSVFLGLCVVFLLPISDGIKIQAGMPAAHPSTDHNHLAPAALGFYHIICGFIGNCLLTAIRTMPFNGDPVIILLVHNYLLFSGNCYSGPQTVPPSYPILHRNRTASPRQFELLQITEIKFLYPNYSSSPFWFTHDHALYTNHIFPAPLYIFDSSSSIFYTIQTIFRGNITGCGKD